MGYQEDLRDRLSSVAKGLRVGESPPVVTVRSFLGWFHAWRRGYWIVKSIREALSEAGLRTELDFESAYIDADIMFVLTSGDSPSQTQAVAVEVAEAITMSDHVEVRVIGGV